MGAEERWMVYRVAGDRYRTPAALVRRVEPFRPPLELPVASALAGVVAVQEGLVAVVSLGADVQAEAARLLVVQTPLGPLGIPCDTVEGLAGADESAEVSELDAQALLSLARRPPA